MTELFIVPDVLPARPVHLLAIHAVGGDGYRGEIGQEVVKQDLLRQKLERGVEAAVSLSAVSTATML
jgi:hypothetical protein